MITGNGNKRTLEHMYIDKDFFLINEVSLRDDCPKQKYNNVCGFMTYLEAKCMAKMAQSPGGEKCKIFIFYIKWYCIT